MTLSAFEEALGPALLGALETKGFSELTLVQQAVLAPELEGRDLRVTSQTGSGKTVAIGLAIRACLAGDVQCGEGGVARPRALVVAPTRELARQVEEELRWLFAPLGAKVASTTGGASYKDERRMLAASPAVVVGTPGRLLEYLDRKGIDGSNLQAIVLDEADRMLDLGFREDLEMIMKFAPEGRRTHLVSATFPRDVQALANRVQKNPAHVQGTVLGKANTDIDHIVHLVETGDRIPAIINVLLAHPDDQTLVFAKMRSEVAEITNELRRAGFGVNSLSGEMDQRERTRALDTFRRGNLRVLVATDVAARGIDVQDIARVIHIDAPNDPDSYTHRSGRTGRAGRKGVSAILAPAPALNRIRLLLQRAGVTYKIEPLPTADDIRRSQDARLFDELTAEATEGSEGFADRTWAIAKRLAEQPGTDRILARLLAKTGHGSKSEPREVRTVELSATRSPLGRGRDAYPERGADRGPPRERGGSFVAFRVSWGATHGADARRLVAMACRRGGIRGTDVGAIRVERMYSLIEVATQVADGFAASAGAPDPRDPMIRIERDGGGPPARGRAPGHDGRGAYGRDNGSSHASAGNDGGEPRGGGSWGGNAGSHANAGGYAGGGAARFSAGPPRDQNRGARGYEPNPAGDDELPPWARPKTQNAGAAPVPRERPSRARISTAKLPAASMQSTPVPVTGDASEPAVAAPRKAWGISKAATTESEPAAKPGAQVEAVIPKAPPSRKSAAKLETAAKEVGPKVPRAAKSAPMLVEAAVHGGPAPRAAAASESAPTQPRKPSRDAKPPSGPQALSGQGFVRDRDKPRGMVSADTRAAPAQGYAADRGGREAPRAWTPRADDRGPKKSWGEGPRGGDGARGDNRNERPQAGGGGERPARSPYVPRGDGAPNERPRPAWGKAQPAGDGNPSGNSAGKAYGNPSGKPGAGAGARPYEKNPGKPSGPRAGKPTPKPFGKPAGKPFGKPTGPKRG